MEKEIENDKKRVFVFVRWLAVARAGSCGVCVCVIVECHVDDAACTNTHTHINYATAFILMQTHLL